MRLALIFAVLLVAGCSRFDARRDYLTVAECYSAFVSISISASDPDLGYSAEDQATQQQVAQRGVDRLRPFADSAIRTVGGNDGFMDMAARWRIQPNFDVGAAANPQAKMAAYQRILGKAGECHEAMTSWGAPKAGGVTGR